VTNPVYRDDWKAGQRVSRKNSAELGVVANVERGVVKVKWDRGRTSYYRPGVPANVMLAKKYRAPSGISASPSC
jgi:hypothetical protein